MPRIAFQGERGAFSEEAAVKLLGERIALVPRPTFRALFASLDEDLADFILAPIENSIAGTVQEAYELLRQHALSVCDEVVFPIVLNLIGCPGASFGNVRTAESHPVALAQCQRFFANHPEIEAITAQDTAGSVASVIARGDQTRAAIASRRAAEVYGGIILQEHLEDQQENYTRFLLLAGTPNRERAVEQTSAARPVRDSLKVRR
jgi:prephenate dehydratase